MSLLVFGATGRVGKAFVSEALASGHAVTAVVRRDDASMSGAVVTTIADVLDPKVASVVKRDHVIVGALGGIDALTMGYANIIAAATSAGAQRILALVGAGVLQADEARLRNQLPGYPAMLRTIGAAHEAVYDALRSSSLDWTLVCVPNIAGGPASGAVKMKASYLPDGTGAITTGDIAAFMIEEIATPRFSRQRVGLNG